MACKYWDVNDPKKGLEESSFEEKYPKDAQGRYHTCQLQEFRTNGATAVTTMCEDLTNPMNGFMHFDNAWGALFVVAQVAIPDAQYEVLTRALDSEPVAWVLTAFFYGFLISGFCTFMELGLFLAVIAKTYDLVEKEHTMKHGTLLRIESHAPAQVMRVRQLLEARAFCFVLYMVIIMQTAMLAVEGYAMEGTRQLLMTVVGDADVEFYVHLSCNIFFGIECFLHFWASSFSVRRLGRHADYLFHFVLLVTSVLGFILSYDPLWPQPVKDVFSTKAVGTVLKASVSLRLYRLMAVLPTLDHILQDAIRSLRSVFNIAIFLFLCTFCVAVTGIYLIGDKMKGRSNFSNLWSAALTSFQIFTRDSWTGIMYDAMDAGESRFWSIINAIFVIFWLFFSSFVVGNLFIATIVTHIKVSDAINDIEKDGYKVWISRQVHRAYNIFLMLKHKSQNQLQNLHQTMSTMQLVKPNSPNFFERQARSPMFSSRLITAHGSPDFVEEEDSLMSYFPDLKKIPVEKRTEFLSTTINVVEDMFSNSQSAHEKKKKKHAAANLTIEYDEPVLCGFSKQFLVRTMCIHIDQNPAFDALIYFVVILSCLIIAIAPQYPDVPGTTPVLGLTYEVGTILNVVFTIIFLAEFIVRTMSRGFFNTRRAYLSLSWNRLDFGILIFALIDLLGIIPSASAGKVLRSARVLSPLRVCYLICSANALLHACIE